MILSIGKLTTAQLIRIKMAPDTILVELLELFEKELEHHKEVMLTMDFSNLHAVEQQNFVSKAQARYQEWESIVAFIKEINEISMEDIYKMTEGMEK